MFSKYCRRSINIIISIISRSIISRSFKIHYFEFSDKWHPIVDYIDKWLLYGLHLYHTLGSTSINMSTLSSSNVNGSSTMGKENSTIAPAMEITSTI